VNDKQTAQLVVGLALLGGAWYLYTRSRGLTWLGQDAHPMLIPGAQTGTSMSPVVQNTSTGLQATNPIAQLLRGVQTVIASIGHAPGNANTRPAQPANGTMIGEQTGNGTGNPGVPYIASELPAWNSNLDDSQPFWNWFDVPPPAPDFAALAWTVDPARNGGVDYGYIPPPPGIATE